MIRREKLSIHWETSLCDPITFVGNAENFSRPLTEVHLSCPVRQQHSSILQQTLSLQTLQIAFRWSELGY